MPPQTISATISQSILPKMQDKTFNLVHTKGLIYNTCWEDPRIDRALLGINGESRLVMITSAGCNTLDYLLDLPAAIHAIDMNYRQNALLQLRIAMLKILDYDTFFEILSRGKTNLGEKAWKRILHELPPYAKAFWEKKKRYFFENGTIRPCFYYHGTSGMAAWILLSYIKRLYPGIYKDAIELLNAASLAEQKIIYKRIHPKLWGPLTTWIVRQPALMNMVGVPRAQARLINNQYPGGLSAYVKDKLKYVLTEVPIHDNYFWRVYITGSYTRDCCPNYLKKENFETLRDNTGRISLTTSTITGFLRKNPGKYTHFILLDHQDWLAWHDRKALMDEWNEIFRNSAPGAKVLMRSAALNLDFLPGSVKKRLNFRYDLSDPLDKTDRVGTYGSLHFAEIL